MATLKSREMIKMSKEELTSKLIELRKELMKENAQVAIGTTPKNPGQLKSMKKTIARILQTLNSKEKEAAQVKTKAPSKEKSKEKIKEE